MDTVHPVLIRLIQVYPGGGRQEPAALHKPGPGAHEQRGPPFHIPNMRSGSHLEQLVNQEIMAVFRRNMQGCLSI